MTILAQVVSSTSNLSLRGQSSSVFFRDSTAINSHEGHPATELLEWSCSSRQALKPIPTEAVGNGVFSATSSLWSAPFSTFHKQQLMGCLVVVSVAAFTSERVDACSSGWVEEGTEQPCCQHGCLHSSHAQKSKYTWGLGGVVQDLLQLRKR